MEDAHIKSVEEVVKYFDVDVDRGLSPDQIKKYQAKYGPNGKSLPDLYWHTIYFVLIVAAVTCL